MEPKRKQLSVRTRFEVFKRDRFTCAYCGRTPPTVVLEVDHILPVAMGGTGESHNLITSCWDCNHGKADRPLSDVPKPLVDQLTFEVEARQQLEEYNAYLMEVRENEQEEARKIGVYWNDYILAAEERGKWTFNRDRLRSIVTFLRRLPIAEIYDAVDIAFGRKPPRYDRDEQTFKFFCGVCWKKIRTRENPQ